MTDQTDQPGAPNPDEANQATATVEWPHQISEEVTEEDLRQHLADHPEAYHPDLVPHINRVIGSTALEAPLEEPKQEQQALTTEEVRARIQAVESGDVRALRELAITPEVLDDYLSAAEAAIRSVAREIDPSSRWAGSKLKADIAARPELKALSRMIKWASNFEGDFSDQYERLFTVMHRDAVDALDKFPEDQQQAAMDTLIEIGDEEDIKSALRSSMPNCPGIDQQKVARTLAETNEGLHLMSQELGQFSGLDPAIADKLLKQQKFMALASWPEAFRDLDRGKLYEKLLHNKAFQAVAKNLGNFPDADQQALVDQMIEHSQAKEILHSLDKFDKLDPTELMHQILTSDLGKGYAVAAYFPDIHRFIDRVDNDIFVNDLLSAGLSPRDNFILRMVVERAQNLTGESAMRLAEAGGSLLVLEYPDSFTEFDPTAILLKGLETSPINDIPSILNAAKNYDLGNIDRAIIAQHLHENTISPEDAYGIYKASRGEPWPELERTVKIFGANAPRGSYYLVSAMMDGIEPDLAPLGVTEAGEAGLEQLEQAIKDLRTKILSADNEEWQGAELARLVGTGTTSTHMVVREVLKGIVRFEESEWGQSTDDAFTEIVMARIMHEQGGIKPLNPEFTASGVVEVSRVDGKEKGEGESPWHEHELKRYETLYISLVDSALAYTDPRPLSTVVQELSDLVEGKRESLLVAIEKLKDNPKKADAVEKLRGQLEVLDSMDLRSVADFEANFVELAKDKKLHPQLMKAMFIWALHKGPEGFSAASKEERQRAITRLTDPHPSLGKQVQLEDMSFVVNMVDHVINQEVFGKYFKTEEARKAFADMTSVKALQEGIARVQGERKKSDRKVPIQFVPTRGLLMEFSGHIADACWAERYDSIAAEFPNITAVNIHRRPGTPQESLVGSFMLIESESTADGSPLLIIRGLNPLETFINQTDIDEFYGAVTGYVRDLAEKTGRKPAIVIDNHSGGSGTNRPALFGYLSAVKRELHNAPAMPRAEDTTFNGYDITKDTYLL